jgi:hypothetical protein
MKSHTHTKTFYFENKNVSSHAQSNVIFSSEKAELEKGNDQTLKDLFY